jgi:hypothetical protein
MREYLTVPKCPPYVHRSILWPTCTIASTAPHPAQATPPFRPTLTLLRIRTTPILPSHASGWRTNRCPKRGRMQQTAVVLRRAFTYPFSCPLSLLPFASLYFVLFIALFLVHVSKTFYVHHPALFLLVSEASLSELCSACVVFAEGKLPLASPSVFIHCMCAHYCCTCTHSLSELCSACVVFAEATYTRPSFPTLTAASKRTSRVLLQWFRVLPLAESPRSLLVAPVSFLPRHVRSSQRSPHSPRLPSRIHLGTCARAASGIHSRVRGSIPPPAAGAIQPHGSRGAAAASVRPSSSPRARTASRAWLLAERWLQQAASQGSANVHLPR